MARLVIRKPRNVSSSYMQLDGAVLGSVNNIVVTEDRDSGELSICFRANRNDIEVAWDVDDDAVG